jgi:hypothetical protein
MEDLLNQDLGQVAAAVAALQKSVVLELAEVQVTKSVALEEMVLLVQLQVHL